MSTPSTPTAQEQNEDIEYKNTALESLETPRSRLESTSTPNLLLGPENIDVPVVPGSPRGNLTRSRTLPRSPSYIPTQTFAELEEDKLRRFRQWMVCIAIVVFDVDYGPRVDLVTPAIDIPQSERVNIAFAAFPDTGAQSVGTQVHSFRIRSELVERLKDTNEGEDSLESADGFLYGFSAFIQQQDKSSKRGYSQRSLVFITQHPFPALWSAAVGSATGFFTKHGNEMLEAACHNISNWPPPTPAATFELGFLGTILHVELPKHIDQQQLTETSSFGEVFDPMLHILASHPPTDIPAVDLFTAILPNLWSLWECLILSEPIFLHAASPAIASAAVWWLRDWLRPLPLAGDFRPYFTIHDPDHKRLINKNATQTVILGTTNPFLHEECKQWPHIISLGSGSTSLSKRQGISKPGLTTPGPPLGFKTSHKRYISKDRVLLKQLENALQPGTSRQERLRVSNLLRQHFSARATGFLVPLNRYLTSLIPTPQSSPNIPSEGPGPALRIQRGPSTSSTSSPSSRLEVSGPRRGASPQKRMAPFSSDDMLASLQRYGSPLPFKSTSKRKEFYERWLRTNAFGAWLMREEEIVKRVLADREKNVAAIGH